MDWRGDGGPEYDAVGLEAPVLADSARAAQARAAEGPPSHTLQECLEVRSLVFRIVCFCALEGPRFVLEVFYRCDEIQGLSGSAPMNPRLTSEFEVPHCVNTRLALVLSGPALLRSCPHLRLLP